MLKCTHIHIVWAKVWWPFPLLHELTNMPFGYSKFPQHGHMEKGARFQSLLYISSAIPNEQGRLKRQNVTFFLKSLLRVLPLWSDNRPPMESSLLSEPAFTYLRIPSKGALPSGSPRSGAIESDAQLPEPPSSVSWSPQWMSPLLWREVPTSRPLLYIFFRVPKKEPFFKVPLAKLP